MLIGITGHRPERIDKDYTLTSPKWMKISELITNILEENLSDELVGVTGMALGVDQIFAQTCVMRNIPFIVVIPDTEQPSLWMKEDKQMYKDLLLLSREVVNIGGEFYHPRHFEMRNRWIVEKCDKLIAVFDGEEKGGTWNCIKFAKIMGREILHINPNLL